MPFYVLPCRRKIDVDCRLAFQEKPHQELNILRFNIVDYVCDCITLRCWHLVNWHSVMTFDEAFHTFFNTVRRLLTPPPKYLVS